MKAYEVLEQYGWCQKAYALDSNNTPVLSTDPSACQFCLYGALARAYQTESGVVYSNVLNALHVTIAQRFSTNPLRWNDTPGRTKEQVVSLLKELDI